MEKKFKFIYRFYIPAMIVGGILMVTILLVYGFGGVKGERVASCPVTSGFPCDNPWYDVSCVITGDTCEPTHIVPGDEIRKGIIIPSWVSMWYTIIVWSLLSIGFYRNNRYNQLT